MQTSVIYGAYGTCGNTSSHAAYTGEVMETGMDCYLLGGRPYHPVLRRFLAPDTESPFDDGGLNRYAYCGGDPVNRVDPDGENFMKWLGVALGVVGTVIATVATGGLATAAVATGITPLVVASLSASAVSIAADVASTVTALMNKTKLSDTLGYIAMGFGLFGVGGITKAATKAVGRIGKQATRLVSKGLKQLGRLRLRSVTPGQMKALSAPGNLTMARRATPSQGVRASTSGSEIASGSSTGTAPSAVNEAPVLPDAPNALVTSKPTMSGGALLKKVKNVYKDVTAYSEDEYGLGRSAFAGEMLAAAGSFLFSSSAEAISSYWPLTRLSGTSDNVRYGGSPGPGFFNSLNVNSDTGRSI